jgi:hypothetical protein
VLYFHKAPLEEINNYHELSLNKKIANRGIDQPEGGYLLVLFYQQKAYIPSNLLLKISN